MVHIINILEVICLARICMVQSMNSKGKFRAHIIYTQGFPNATTTSTANNPSWRTGILFGMCVCVVVSVIMLLSLLSFCFVNVKFL